MKHCCYDVIVEARSRTAAIAGGITGAVILIIIILCIVLWCYCHVRRQRQFYSQSQAMQVILSVCLSVRPPVCLSWCNHGTLYTTTPVFGLLVHQEGAICTTQAQYAPRCTRETMFFSKSLFAIAVILCQFAIYL